MHRNKLIQWGLLVVFITIMVGLIYHAQDAQIISFVKAASQALPDGDLSVVGKPTLPAAPVDASRQILTMHLPLQCGGPKQMMAPLVLDWRIEIQVVCVAVLAIPQLTMAIPSTLHIRLLSFTGLTCLKTYMSIED